MKNRFFHFAFFTAGLLVYVLSFVATSKQLPLDPCYLKASDWFIKDTFRRYSHLSYINTDSFLINADTTKNVNWALVCDSLCTITKNDCNKTGHTVLVVNRLDTNRAIWDTRYGKSLVIRKCP